MSRLFGGGGDDRGPPTERQAIKPSGARPTPAPHEHALTWPSAGVPQEEPLPLERVVTARPTGNLVPEGNGVRWYPASRDATPPVPRAVESVQRISSPGLSLDAARMRAALVVSDTSLTEDELSAPAGRQTLPTLHGLGSALDSTAEAALAEAGLAGAVAPGLPPVADAQAAGSATQRSLHAGTLHAGTLHAGNAAGTHAQGWLAGANGMLLQASSAHGGAASNGTHFNGVNGAHPNGFHLNGSPSNGAHANGVHSNGVHSNGAHANGVHSNGVHSNGAHANGVQADAAHWNGAGDNGSPVNGGHAGAEPANGWARAESPGNGALVNGVHGKGLGVAASPVADLNGTLVVNGSAHASGAQAHGADIEVTPPARGSAPDGSSTLGRAIGQGSVSSAFSPAAPPPAAPPPAASATAAAGLNEVAPASRRSRPGAPLSSRGASARGASVPSRAEPLPSGPALLRPPSLDLGPAASQLAAAALAREAVEAPPADAVASGLELLVDLSFRLALGPVSEDWMVAGAGAARVLSQASRAGWQPHLLASFEGLELLLTQGSRNRALPVLWRLSDSVTDWPSSARNLRDRARRCERRVVSELLASVDGLRARPRSRFAQEKTLVYLVAAGPEQLAAELDTPLERARDLARLVQSYDAERRSSPVDIGHRRALRRATEELAERQREFESGEEDLREARQRRRQALTRVNLVLAERGDLEHLVELEPLAVAERIERLRALVGPVSSAAAEDAG